MISSPPCKDCQKKYLGCHSKCEDYIEYDKWRQEVRAKKTTSAIVHSIARDRFRRKK